MALPDITSLSDATFAQALHGFDAAFLPKKVGDALTAPAREAAVSDACALLLLHLAAVSNVNTCDQFSSAKQLDVAYEILEKIAGKLVSEKPFLSPTDLGNLGGLREEAAECLHWEKCPGLAAATQNKTLTAQAARNGVRMMHEQRNSAESAGNMAYIISYTQNASAILFGKFMPHIRDEVISKAADGAWRECEKLFDTVDARGVKYQSNYLAEAMIFYNLHARPNKTYKPPTAEQIGELSDGVLAALSTIELPPIHAAATKPRGSINIPNPPFKP